MIRKILIFVSVGAGLSAAPVIADIQDREGDMLARYERAQGMAKGVFDQGLVLNATLYPNWIDDSDSFWYKRQLKNGHEFRLVNAKKASNQKAFNHKALAKALSKASDQKVDFGNLPLVNLTVNVDKSLITFDAFESSWLYADKSSKLKKTNPVVRANTKGRAWLISPSGKQAVVLKEHNLWLRDLESGAERPLTTDGEALYRYGVSSLAWGPHAGQKTKIEASWSQDGKYLLTVQRDMRQVKPQKKIYFTPQNGSGRIKVVDEYWPIPEDENIGEFRLLAIHVESGEIIEADDLPLPDVHNAWGIFTDRLAWWSEDNQQAYYIKGERGNQRVSVMAFDVKTGKSRVIFTEQTDLYIKFTPDSEMPPMFQFLPETEELVWYSDRSGWGHLYLYDLKTSTVKKTITSGDWGVSGVLHLDKDKRELLIRTNGRVKGRDPYYKDIVRLNIDSGTMTDVVSSNHEYHTSMSGAPVSVSGNYIVTTKSRINTVPVSLLLDRHGKQIMEIETADVSGLPEGWQWPEPFKMTAADGKTDIYGAIYRPSDFDANKQYPVLEYTGYTAPEAISTMKGAFENNYMIEGLLSYSAMTYAELGFIVVSIDGRGGSFQSKEFQAVSKGLEGPALINQADRIAGIKQMAAQYPYMDLDRVGITGWRGSNQPLYALIDHPEFYKVGILPQVHDFRVMNEIWGGRYEGASPDPVLWKARHYENNIDKFQGKLLIQHGILSWYNQASGSFRVIEALKKANKDFDMLIMADEAGVPSNYTMRRMWDFLVRNLSKEEPPQEFKLTIPSYEAKSRRGAEH